MLRRLKYLCKHLILYGRCETRTHGIWLRRPALYPTELIALVKAYYITKYIKVLNVV